MTEDETRLLYKIMEFADGCAMRGNGEAHLIYVKLRDLVDGSGSPEAKKMIISGYEVTPMIMSFIKERKKIEAIKEMRTLHGISLQEAKSLIDSAEAQMGIY